MDVDEPSGTIGAAYAYAYQSGNIYMQDYGGQWVIVSESDAPLEKGEIVFNEYYLDYADDMLTVNVLVSMTII